MSKFIIRTYLQCSLLVVHLNGIIALLWRYDLYQRNGSYVSTGILVGDTRGNHSVIVKESENFKKALEQGEVGYDLDDHDVRKLGLWPEGIIPYFIDAVSYDKDYRNNLRRMLMEINYLSGIHFQELARPPANEKSRYVFFINRIGSSCTQSVVITHSQFTNHGVQKVVLGYNSLSNGDMYGFVLAVAGIPPQNNAPNRDRYITVRKENILQDKLHFFEVLRDDEWLYHDLAYDYGSASHFRYHEYTRNGYATIKPKLDVPEAMGQGLTFYDVLKMRRTYNYISRKIFVRIPDTSKMSYMYMTTPAPGVQTSKHLKGMHFGNPDDPKKKYDEGKYDDFFKLTNKPGKPVTLSTPKDPREKHHKFVGENYDGSTSIEGDKLDYNLFKANNDNKDYENKKHKKGSPRPKPNKYLGIPGDDPVRDEEEYIPQQTEKVEVLMSEDIDLYISESSQERGTTKPFKKNKHMKANSKRVNLNI